MPRKQRFKPSRKPKPVPRSESEAIGHEARNPGAHDTTDVPGGPSRLGDESSSSNHEIAQG